jgi:hypothetical protein
MSFISQVEASVEEVAEWGATLIDRAVTALSPPDGRPFLYAEQSELESIIEYMDLRGEPELWAKWIGDTAGEIMKKLQDAAVPPDEIMAVHPVDIAIKMAIEYSYDMEQLIKKKAGAEAVPDEPKPPVSSRRASTTARTASPGASAILTGII